MSTHTTRRLYVASLTTVRICTWVRRKIIHRRNMRWLLITKCGMDDVYQVMGERWSRVLDRITELLDWTVRLDQSPRWLITLCLFFSSVTVHAPAFFTAMHTFSVLNGKTKRTWPELSSAFTLTRCSAPTVHTSSWLVPSVCVSKIENKLNGR